MIATKCPFDVTGRLKGCGRSAFGYLFVDIAALTQDSA